MRSRDNARRAAERVLRAGALVALAVLAVRLWRGTGDSTVAAVASPSLDSALVVWSRIPPGEATVNATDLPTRAQRDWLVALRRTGSTVAWVTSDTAGVALVVEPGPLPASPARVLALGPANTSVILRDELGVVDSAQTGSGRVASWRASPIGVATATIGATVARATIHDSLGVRPVLVVGRAGWESRFVVTALEEDGWPVQAVLTVAPGAVVRQGGPVRIDTASLSALVVLDSTSTIDASVVARFVRDGGGLVASGAGVNHPALRAMLALRHAGGSAGELGALLGPNPRTGLFARTFNTATGGVPIERRNNATVIVARRSGAGRVTALGYDDTWRLRMTSPDDGAPGEHRRWWSSLVAGVARVGVAVRAVPPADEAPYAASVQALGDPIAIAGVVPKPAVPWEAVIAGLALVSLLAEWASRRLRGQS